MDAEAIAAYSTPLKTSFMLINSFPSDTQGLQVPVLFWFGSSAAPTRPTTTSRGPPIAVELEQR
jgi:hypothetical protein